MAVLQEMYPRWSRARRLILEEEATQHPASGVDQLENRYNACFPSHGSAVYGGKSTSSEVRCIGAVRSQLTSAVGHPVLIHFSLEFCERASPAGCMGRYRREPDN
jgi:hypothetical protein